MAKGRKPKLRVTEPGEISPVIIPDPPATLSRQAKHQWRVITKELAAVGRISEIDRAALVQFCECWGRWREATIRLNKEGGVAAFTIDGKSGPVKNPLLTIIADCENRILRYLGEFGLFKQSTTKKKVDPFEDFQKRGRTDGKAGKATRPG